MCLIFRGGILEVLEGLEALEGLENLEVLERLERLERLEDLEMLELFGQGLFLLAIEALHLHAQLVGKDGIENDAHDGCNSKA